MQTWRPAALMPSESQSDSWTLEKAPGPRHRIDLLSLVPLLSIVALVALVAVVIGLVNRSEAEQGRIKLATDALWVEQTLRFQMEVDEDMLARLALEAGSDIAEASMDTRTRLHIAANPELLSVVWYDAARNRVRELPGRGAPGDDSVIELLSRLDTPFSRPTYGAVQPDGSVSMGIMLAGGKGYVAATISLPLLLHRHVPWWIAEQYGVRITAMDGRELAARQRLPIDEGNPFHAIGFDPPLRGTILQITAYDTPSPYRYLLLLGAMGGLAAFSILALVILYRSAQSRRRVEQRLRNETAFRRSMEESLTVGLRAKDHSGKILYVNAAFCNLVGWEAHELVGRGSPMPYWDPSRLQETEARHRAQAEAGAVGQSFETRFLHRDGREIDIQVYDAPLIDASGKQRGWMGSIIDITEQKRAARLSRLQDEAMARTGRLVTLGEMASTLAHELNQPLSAIASYSAGMKNLIDRGDAERPVLLAANEKLAVQAGRAGRIIRRIQDLVKKRAPRFEPTRLERVIAETIGFLEADAREHRVRLVPRIGPAPPVEADRILLEQVLINLIRNGMEAMTDQRSGDTLEIRLRHEDGFAVIEIEDRGAGIPDELTERLFDAFATTKSQGMGMGLKICRSIVELHRGKLSHRPAAGGGTVFTVELPTPGDGGTAGA